MVVEILVYFLILLSAIPVGFFLAWLCDDEVIYGKKWFRIIAIILILLIIGLFLFYYNLPVILSLIYLLIITLIGLYYSK